MSSIIKLEPNGNIRAEVQKGVGYTIRHTNCVGATFTVDEELHIIIGQSGRKHYTFDEWKEINTALNVALSYMSKVRVLGCYPFEHDDSYKNSNTTIKPKDYKKCCMYLDDKGRAILYIGKAIILKNRYGFSCNRENSPYVCGFFNANSVLGMKTVGSTINILCKEDTSDYIEFDSRVNKPRGLIKLLYEGRGSETKFCVNGVQVLELRYRPS